MDGWVGGEGWVDGWVGGEGWVGWGGVGGRGRVYLVIWVHVCRCRWVDGVEGLRGDCQATA